MKLFQFLMGQRMAFCFAADGDGAGAGGAGDPPPSGSPTNTPPAGPAPSPFAVPAEYANEGWVKGRINSVDDLWKATANAQSLIGRQGIKLPAANATPEEKAAWNAEVMRTHFGAPADPKGYEFEAVQGVTRAPAREEFARKMFHELNVPAATAKEIVKRFESLEATQSAEAAKVNAELDKQFNDLSKNLWGDKAPAVIEKLGTLLAAEVPEALKPMIEKLPGEALLALGTLVDNVHQRYSKKSAFLDNLGKMPYAAPADGFGTTLDELSASQRKVMMDPGFRDPMAPNFAELQAVNAKIREAMTKHFTQSS